MKFLVRLMTMADARKLAETALTLTSATEIYRLCDEFYRARVRAE